MQDLEQCIHNTENRFCRPRNFLGIHAAGEMRMRLRIGHFGLLNLNKANKRLGYVTWTSAIF